jgi:hypothetical protein
VFALGSVHVKGHKNLHLDKIPSEEILCILQPLSDHEYNGILGLLNKNLKRIDVLAATKSLVNIESIK